MPATTTLGSLKRKASDVNNSDYAPRNDNVQKVPSSPVALGDIATVENDSENADAGQSSTVSIAPAQISSAGSLNSTSASQVVAVASPPVQPSLETVRERLNDLRKGMFSSYYFLF